MPPVEDFFEYFKETNSSSNKETLNFDDAGEILNIPT